MSGATIPIDSARNIDVAEVERALRLLVDPGETFEIRGIVVDRTRGFESIHSGYFTDPSIAARAVAKVDSPDAVGWYVTLNPVDAALRARRADRIGKAGKDSTTKDHHVTKRLRLLLDFDASRPTGISSSESEHTAALKLAAEAAAELADRGWPEPLHADSGNGAHLDYAIDLQAEDEKLVERVLYAAQARFGGVVDGVTIKVDVANHNPSRITKLYGTKARKGDNVSERPHRLSRIIRAPEKLTPVSREALEAFAAEYGPKESESPKAQTTSSKRKPGRQANSIDAAAWLARHDIKVISVDPHYVGKDGAGTLYVIQCPRDPEHDNAYVIQWKSGAVCAGCHHSTCKTAGVDWDWLRALHDPKPDRGARIVTRDWSSLGLAEVVLRDLGLDDAGRQTLARWAGDWWQYSNGHHRVVDDEEWRALVWGVLRRVDIDRPGNPKKGEPPRVIEPLPVISRLVSEIADAALAIADRVPATAELPYALGGYQGPSPDRIAVVRNGLLELAAKRLHARTPRVFATAGAAVDYVPDAECPQWQKFLVDVFTDDEDGTDEETIRLVRQIFGWLIAGDTSRHVIPLFFGLPRSGKSTIANIARLLLGEGNVCAPPLSSLAESRFGLAPLVGKSLAIIPDARLGARADQVAIAGLLLAASGRDVITIDRKNRDAIEARLRCRIMLVTNELPRIADASGALASRWLIVETRRSFLGREDLGLEARLRSELSGILTWSIEGWHDLEQNGWARSGRADEIADELDRLGSPTKAFIADRLVVSTGAETSLDVLFREWIEWCQSAGRKEPGTRETFGRDLRAAIPPGVRVSRPRSQTGGGRPTVYVGLGLRIGGRP